MKAVFLPALGIDSNLQHLDPSVESFPPAFNSANRPIWEAVIRSHRMLEDSVQLNWASVINKYVDQCVNLNRYPFTNSSSNDFLIKALASNRHAVVKFLNRVKLLKMVEVKSTKREVILHSTGFTLRVYGRIILKDPMFESWLTRIPLPSFNLRKNGEFVKPINSNTKLFVYNEGIRAYGRWYLGYEINVSSYPSIPTNHTPNKAELKAFILNVLWLPVLRLNRTQEVRQRLL